MRNLESRQWVCNTILVNGQASLICIPPKTGFSLFVTGYVLSVSASGASTFVAISDSLGNEFFEASATVLTSHRSPVGFKGFLVTPGEGVYGTASAAGARFTLTVEGYYEPINV